MRGELSERVYQFFASSVRECTPTAALPIATVLFAPAALSSSIADQCTSVLSQSERSKAESFLTADLRARFHQQRAFRRYCGALAANSAIPLSRIEFKTTKKGRPYLAELPGYWFSFSSCRRGFLGAWSSTHGIGIDIEDPTQSLETIELARAWFSRAEANAVEGAPDQSLRRTFFQLWTAKEAALKSIGEGVPFGLDAFQFDLSGACASSMRHEPTAGRDDLTFTRSRSPVAAPPSHSAAPRRR
jgi:phosphopantetheinyl transferase